MPKLFFFGYDSATSAVHLVRILLQRLHSYYNYASNLTVLRATLLCRWASNVAVCVTSHQRVEVMFHRMEDGRKHVVRLRPDRS